MKETVISSPDNKSLLHNKKGKHRYQSERTFRFLSWQPSWILCKCIEHMVIANYHFFLGEYITNTI